MDKQVPISVIIPCYNCAELIGETLTLLTQQTFKNFEVICINDGSKDNTATVLEEWRASGKLNMTILHQENGGVSRARNTGIQIAHGEYLLFLDADDGYHPRFIECLYGAIEQSGMDVAYCMLSRCSETVQNAVIPDDGWYTIQDQSTFMHNLLYRMGDFGFYCYLYRADVLKNNAIEFDVNTRHFEDREFNWKYLCHCFTAAFIEAPLYWYRVNVNSVTQNKAVTWKTEDLQAVLRIEEYMKKRACEFYSELKSYLFARVIWGKAKRYAAGRYKEYFQRLRNEYDVKHCMRRTARDDHWMVALASRLYLINPWLMYYSIAFFSKIKPM